MLKLLEWVSAVVAGGMAVWLRIEVPDIAAWLAPRFGSRSLRVFGWLPIGGFALAAGLVGLRCGVASRAGRRLPRGERWAYSLLFCWGLFAAVMAGYRGKRRLGDAESVRADVAAGGADLLAGHDLGLFALLLIIGSALVWLAARLVLRLQPGWPWGFTVASWLLPGASLTLALALIE